MPAVLERAVQPNEVLLVVRVGVAQLAQNLRLLKPRFVPIPHHKKRSKRESKREEGRGHERARRTCSPDS